MNPLNETKFEEHITEYLAASALYNQRTSAQFDIEKLFKNYTIILLNMILQKAS